MLLSHYQIRYPKPLIWRLGASVFDTLGMPLRLFSLPLKREPRKILVIRKDEIGDLILSLPLYDAIKQAYPKSELHVLAGKAASPLLENNPNIDKVIPIETIRNNKKAFLAQYFHLLSNLRKERYDLTIDPKGSILNILLMYFIGAKNRLSYWNVSGGKPLLTHAVKYEKEIHDIDASLGLLLAYGAKVKRVLPKIYFTKSELKEGKSIASKLPKGYCCAYMTPTSPYKAWPMEKWHDLFKRFPKTPFIIIAREQEKETLEKNFNDLKNVSILCLHNLRILAIVLQNAKAIVAVDGGMMHLSWISNQKTISLFGQVDLTLLLPPQGTPICHCPSSEQGLCRLPIESQKPNKYMEMISVDEVSAALKRYLK